MNKIKEIFLENYIKIILLTLCYLFYNEYYNILIYLFLLYVISVVGFLIFTIFRSYKLKELITKLKTVLTGSFLLKIFYLLIIIGFVVKSIPSVLDSLTFLYYGENKEKMINAIVGDNSKINVRSDGSTFRSFNDNNNGIIFISTLPYSSTVSDTIFTNKTKEETINVLKEIFSDKQISKLQDYDIYFKFQYYNQKDYLVKEINIDPNEDF